MLSIVQIIAVAIWLAAFLVRVVSDRSPGVIYAGLVYGFLLLPQFGLELPGIYVSKAKLVIMVSAILALCVDRSGCPRMRFSVWDCFAFAIPAAAFVSSISNGLGAKDGLYHAISMAVLWTLPWLIGRFVLGAPRGVSAVIRHTIAGALMYVPLCVFEMKMAPVLHAIVYGAPPRGGESLAGIALRFGLWRPTVFMETGLQLSLFMGISSVLACWAWRNMTHATGRLVSPGVAAISLGITTCLCVSFGALMLTVVGWGLVWAWPARACRSAIASIALLCLCYPIFRIAYPGAISVSPSASHAGLRQRQASLATRIKSEDLYIEYWSRRPLFGWTPLYYHRASKDAIPDSMWVQLLTKFGVFGWASWGVLLAMPAVRVAASQGGVSAVEGEPQVVLAIGALLFLCDCLANAMENPIYVVMAGCAAVLSDDTALQISSGRQETLGVAVFRMRRTQWPRRNGVGIPE